MSENEQSTAQQDPDPVESRSSVASKSFAQDIRFWVSTSLVLTVMLLLTILASFGGSRGQHHYCQINNYYQAQSGHPWSYGEPVYPGESSGGVIIPMQKQGESGEPGVEPPMTRDSGSFPGQPYAVPAR